MEFTATEEVEVVPVKWLNESTTLAYWPNHSGDKLQKDKRKTATTAAEWPQYAVRSLCRNARRSLSIFTLKCMPSMNGLVSDFLVTPFESFWDAV